MCLLACSEERDKLLAASVLASQKDMASLASTLKARDEQIAALQAKIAAHEKKIQDAEWSLKQKAEDYEESKNRMAIRGMVRTLAASAIGRWSHFSVFLFSAASPLFSVCWLVPSLPFSAAFSTGFYPDLFFCTLVSMCVCVCVSGGEGRVAA